MPPASRPSWDILSALCQVIAVRLREAGIWEEDEVRCERWFNPENGGLALLLDLMVAEGKLIRRWSEKDKRHAWSGVRKH